MRKMMYIVMCTAGLHEIYGEWPVAVFTEREKAQWWCDQANKYGAWMVEMKLRDSKDREQVDALMYDESMSEEEILEASENEPSTQYQWAIFGSPGQFDGWVDKWEAENPGKNCTDYWTRELSLILNPYDLHAFWARDERSIKYSVVEVPYNPFVPFFP